MPRAIDGTRRTQRRKKITNQTKGYWGRRKNVHRTAKDALAKSLEYAYRDRKTRKRDFRRLWIARINAACRARGITYSRFIEGLTKADVRLNRKALSNLAITDRDAFDELIKTAKTTIGA